eukprot:COSAG02_NODE_37789_length_437_cov_1.118343_1_plen_79_part_01
MLFRVLLTNNRPNCIRYCVDILHCYKNFLRLLHVRAYSRPPPVLLDLRIAHAAGRGAAPPRTGGDVAAARGGRSVTQDG